MSEELPSSLSKAVDSLRSTVDTLESTMKPWLAAPSKEVRASLPPVERAKYSANMLFAANSLLFIYLKASGVATGDHPIQDQMKRTKGYFARIEETKKKVEEKEKRRSLVIDKEAGNRMVKAALSDAGASKSEQTDASSDSRKSKQKGGKGQKNGRGKKRSGAGKDEGSPAPGKRQRVVNDLFRSSANPVSQRTSGAASEASASFGSAKRSTLAPTRGHLSWQKDLERMKRRK